MVYTPFSKYLPFIPIYTNISKQMAQLGLACVYEGKTGDFGTCEAELRKAEENAKRKKVGIWSVGERETPMEYKKRNR
jgi:endonuclease YncB( thermonuclease family)